MRNDKPDNNSRLERKVAVQLNLLPKEDAPLTNDPVLAEYAARESPGRLTALRYDNLIQSYMRALELIVANGEAVANKTLKEFPLLRKDESINARELQKRAHSLREDWQLTVEIADIYAKARERFRDSPGTIKGLTSVLKRIMSQKPVRGSSPRSGRIRHTARNVYAAVSSDALDRWIRTANIFLRKGHRRNMDVFFQYRFKEVYGQNAVVDEFRMFPAIFKEEPDKDRRIDSRYALPMYIDLAQPVKKETRTSKRLYELECIAGVLYHHFARFETGKVSENTLVFDKLESVLEDLGERTGFRFSGYENMEITAVSKAGNIEDILGGFPAGLKNHLRTDLKRLETVDLSDFHSGLDRGKIARDYPVLKRMITLAKKAGKRRRKAISVVVKKEGKRLLQEMTGLIDERLGGRVPALRQELQDLEEALYPRRTDVVKVNWLLEPYDVIINSTGGCVFESRDHSLDTERTKYREASLLYSLDPAVNILILESYAISEAQFDPEKNDDLAAAILVDTQNDEGLPVLLVDGVVPSQGAKHFVSKRGHDWKDVMLRSILKYSEHQNIYALAFNISHGSGEKREYEFIRHLLSRVFSQEEGEFYNIHPDYGIVFTDEDTADLPFGTSRSIRLTKNSKDGDSISSPRKNLRTGFFHSWHIENMLSGKENPYWNRGRGRVRAVVFRSKKLEELRKRFPATRATLDELWAANPHYP